ncbi:hypothetical protein Patl1_31187 [Pistacia atlantica]|uniref:Uncharacterized protein n=1 Tax=Pistacia atlantica TaxID=434234 RepID=A0ACC1A8C9_9ROSI|nr:hypothetical protein Patl1_31187 [Pistacia atlantica]
MKCEESVENVTMKREYEDKNACTRRFFLILSLITKTPLTETFLQRIPAPELNQKGVWQHQLYKNQNGRSSIERKYKDSHQAYCQQIQEMVYYTDRCQAISEFNEHKAMLLCPKLAPNFGYENHPLGIEEDNTNIPNFRFVSSEQTEGTFQCCIQYLNKARIESIYSMTTDKAKAISLKALVDKENNRVIFAESDVDFTDVLLSFLTMPMGTIIRLISNHNQPPTVAVGCMNNLYESIKNLDMQFFRSEACKTMLLCPRNDAAPQNKRLKLQIDDGELPRYFLCTTDCTLSGHKLLSLYPNAVCECGKLMDRTMELSEKTVQKLVFDARDRGVFVKGLTQFIISDELQVKPSSIEASVSVLSKLGLMDCSAIKEYKYSIVDIGVDEVLTLLKCSLVSKKPLTETLLKQNSAPKFGKEDFDQNIYVKSTVEEPDSNVDGKIHVKLIISKSKKIVCFAEASKEFVDLVSSFLTVPLGYIIKEMQSGFSKGSLTHLYNSVQELDAEKYLKSYVHKEMLINPKLAPYFRYENHPLGIEEGLHPTYRATEYYYYDNNNKLLYRHQLTSDGEIPSGSYTRSSILTVKDPKSQFKEARRGGFVSESTMFTVTDNLIITPISQFESLSLLNKLKVPFSDIEERVVHVGHEKALRLLVASFVSESALTNAFLREPNPYFN